MVTDEQGKQLHDRASRGETLTPLERSQMEEWYAAVDVTETEALGLSLANTPSSSLYAQIDAALARLVIVTKRIQDVSAENDTLRLENAMLRQQLASQGFSQSV